MSSCANYVYSAIPWQALFTAEWLTAFGTIGTGLFAAWAAAQSYRVAHAEHERLKAADTAKAKAFIARIAMPLYLYGTTLSRTARTLQLHAEGGLSRESYASLSTLQQAVKDMDLSLVRESPELIALLPGGLPQILNAALTESEAFPSMVADSFRGDGLFEYGELGLPIGLTAKGREQATTVARLTLQLAGKLHGCLKGMEKYVGVPLAPWSETDKSPVLHPDG